MWDIRVPFSKIYQLLGYKVSSKTYVRSEALFVQGLMRNPLTDRYRNAQFIVAMKRGIDEQNLVSE